MMEPIQFVGCLHRIAKDHQGEVVVTFKVSKTQAMGLLSIPEETALTVHIEEDREDSAHER